MTAARTYLMRDGFNGFRHSWQTSSICGNRFYRHSERSHCFGLSLFRQSTLSWPLLTTFCSFKNNFVRSDCIFTSVRPGVAIRFFVLIAVISESRNETSKVDLVRHSSPDVCRVRGACRNSFQCNSQRTGSWTNQFCRLVGWTLYRRNR